MKKVLPLAVSVILVLLFISHLASAGMTNSDRTHFHVTNNTGSAVTITNISARESYPGSCEGGASYTIDCADSYTIEAGEQNHDLCSIVLVAGITDSCNAQLLWDYEGMDGAFLSLYDPTVGALEFGGDHIRSQDKGSFSKPTSDSQYVLTVNP